MDFRHLEIKTKYKSLNDDVLSDFYIPVLENSIEYKRAVGYFSSKILIDYTKGLKKFLHNEGKIKLIISPFLSSEDLDVLNDSIKEESMKKIDDMFHTYLKNDQSFASGKVLFVLLKMKMIEIKVAVPKNEYGLFHDKIGIFVDGFNNRIAISGSNNETSNSVNYNIESFNTFSSWKIGQDEYVKEHEKDFEIYWNNQSKNTRLFDLEEAISSNILKLFETDETLEELIVQVLEEEKFIYEGGKGNISPYDYQLEAVDKWFETKRGIFKFATGTGKTKTAIYLMDRLEMESDKNFFVIVVPDKTLVNQWNDELVSYNKNTLRCFSDNKDWHIEFFRKIDISKVKEKYNYYVIVTNDSFISTKFQRELTKLKDDYLLVVDECHSWGANSLINNLPNAKMRLGLSATPELFFSEEKTKVLLDFFGGITYEYSLEQAIMNKKLVGYYYYPIVVSFTEDERIEYAQLTQKIVKMIGSDTNDLNDRNAKFGQILEMLLFKRSRIIYGARNKIVELSKIINELSNKGNLLVYCGPTSYMEDLENEVERESLTQLQVVNKLLGEKGIKFAQYTSKENEVERYTAIEMFKKEIYSTLVAIKCLDEGVNIPQIERAIILSSSTNPREFVQRRGRILRTAYGKKYSEIFDFIVMDSEFPLLNNREIARLYEFSRIAINRSDIFEKFNQEIEEFLNYDSKGDNYET